MKEETRNQNMVVLRHCGHVIIAEGCKRRTFKVFTRIIKKLSEIYGVNVEGYDTRQFLRNNVEHANTLTLYGDRFDIGGKGWKANNGHKAYLHFV